MRYEPFSIEPTMSGSANTFLTCRIALISLNCFFTTVEDELAEKLRLPTPAAAVKPMDKYSGHKDRTLRYNLTKKTTTLIYQAAEHIGVIRTLVCLQPVNIRDADPKHHPAYFLVRVGPPLFIIDKHIQ
jgi:hypothetical protein